MHFFEIFTLLFVIVLAAGCMGTEKITPANPSVEKTLPVTSTSLIGVTPSQNATMKSCPIPKLVFNNSQEITKLDSSKTGLRFTGHNTLPSSGPYTVPFGGVVYHEAGFTRIFDS
jgi:hypothetical protein